MLKIGLIREGKNPPDKRVVFSPTQLKRLQAKYAGELRFFVQESPVRCFDDAAYAAAGFPPQPDLSACDVLLGVKEVPIAQLMAGKQYFFFSHTIKAQPYNRDLLRAILAKDITLYDHEVLKKPSGERVVAFGRWAGIVGAYMGLWTYGEKSGRYRIKQAKDCFDLAEMLEELKKVELPALKLLITGRGRVGLGALEIIRALGIPEVQPEALLREHFPQAVFAVLDCQHYAKRAQDGGFQREEFFTHPERYVSSFQRYTEVADMLIAAAYWDHRAPRLFEREDVGQPGFKLRVIADITCDIDGSIPTTIRPSTIAEPVYDLDLTAFQELPAFSGAETLSVMAIDNLPTALPRDASEDFGEQFAQYVLPELLLQHSEVLEGACIARGGQLGPHFTYLQSYVDGD
ncbi:saccharopine dehydrogenase [Nitritalea halalkaliphila LW7]|uniref:Saccharopine dehydrogenase [NAD(+), L-lysine-forming] n=1 Tax=Nitritalea halalkaliphila LW7 TaxID=1189621 RepID=I5BVW1_9BACT|nr:NAD(P)-dependent oxidoreductase [Nitritalea halalkaliphila]EIM73713.1 saccharopine dehydrogenase [Nitritalea halalkaliphila LW7]